MKQTAVEWLIARFESGDMYNVEDAQFIKHQAIKMEKEQSFEFWQGGINCTEEGGKSFEQYYKETYEK